uniref:ATP synthase CF1 epsilon subunit n=1 Tax=Nitzschia sp. NIES-3576 TaxID=2083273 RepID=A0A2Z5ZAM3_9STRA|nr:ATP synthase CF1 epsilon subunit [Nitzschia sp. NIES-3576]
MIVYIYSLANNLEEKNIDTIILPSKKGQINILDKHINLITILKMGLLRFKKSSKWNSFIIYKGIAEIKKNIILVLTNKIEQITKLNAANANKNLESILLNLQKAKTNKERLNFSSQLEKEIIFLEAIKYLP